MKNILLAAFLSTLVPCALAQETTPEKQAGPFEIPMDNMDQLKEALNLSEEQLAKWNEVNNKYYPNLRELQDADSLDQRAKTMKARNIFADRDAELKEFIFAAQWDTYQSMKMKARRAGMKTRREEMMKKRKEIMEKKQQGNGNGEDQ